MPSSKFLCGFWDFYASTLTHHILYILWTWCLKNAFRVFLQTLCKFPLLLKDGLITFEGQRSRSLWTVILWAKYLRNALRDFCQILHKPTFGFKGELIQFFDVRVHCNYKQLALESRVNYKICTQTFKNNKIFLPNAWPPQPFFLIPLCSFTVCFICLEEAHFSHYLTLIFVSLFLPSRNENVELHCTALQTATYLVVLCSIIIMFYYINTFLLVVKETNDGGNRLKHQQSLHPLT